jgi:DNA-binding protein Fis
MIDPTRSTASGLIAQMNGGEVSAEEVARVYLDRIDRHDLGRREPALLAEVLAQLQGNRLAASRWLGLARATVRKLIARHLPGEAAGGDGEE